GFSTQSFGPAFSALANGLDTTNAANRVLVVNAAFDTGSVRNKGAMAKGNFAFFKFGDTSATDITFDVFVPASMPDSARFDLALAGPATGGNWVQDEVMLGSPGFQKGAWNTLDFNIARHIADGSITSPRLTATFYVQVYYNAGKKWNGTIFFDNLTLLGIDAFTGLARSPSTPYEYRLYNNYPNPFNPSTTIRYELKQEGPVSLRIFDVLGREVATLVNERQGAGPHSVVFDANRLATGAYFYTLHAGAYIRTEKMMLIK
ncbi:MAG TPA: T9SS type A sorting domain-containing protein, partial [Bacteroidota bacterium]|nr:T9SS type A sorting domain-containing protein [Bacteroidota bacterium]